VVRFETRVVRASRIASGLTAGIALVSLVGWMSGHLVLASVLPAQTTMKPITIVSFILMAMSCAFVTAQREGVRRLGRAVAGVAVVLPLLTLLETSTGAQLGIDEWLFRGQLRDENILYPGRMATMTAISLVLVAAGLVLSDRRPELTTATAAAATLIGTIALLGYAFDAPPLYRLQPFNTMALPTAAAITTVGLALTLSQPTRGLLGVAGSQTLGGTVVRRVVPSIVLVEMAVAGAVVTGQRREWYSGQFGLAIFVAATLAVTVGIVWRTGLLLVAVDAERANLLRTLEERVAARTAELAAANLELARSNAHLDEFASVAAHDLKSPLSTIAGFASMLDSGLAGELNPDAKECASYLVRGVKHMQTLVDDLLTFARVGTTAEKLPVSLTTIAEDVRLLLTADIEASNASVVIGALPEVTGDPGQLRQLLLNLVANGIKFHRAGVAPVVEITSYAEGSRWQVRVADNGIGIDPRFRERVFKMFQRLHGADDYVGTGIGLAVCRRVVENHGGRIWIEESPSGGSVFCFDLPGVGQ
jgi:signal transduction histidine kinase